ncbi:hypothetical protein GCM10010244_55890 [Streptomyces coeruleorubidus]|nr:hypothetical protein GCM10010244_55890 [Streptomyces bellus]
MVTRFIGGLRGRTGRTCAVGGGERDAYLRRGAAQPPGVRDQSGRFRLNGASKRARISDSAW